MKKTPSNRPYVICHSLGSLDGRIKQDIWGLKDAPKYFEEPAEKIKVDAWLVGRVTMEEFSSKKPYVKRKGRFQVPPGDFVATKAKTYAVAIDPSGKCHWETNKVSTEHVIEVLSEQVSSEYLDHLRSQGVSYVFGGPTPRELDLALVLQKLRKLFDIKRLRVDGGGKVNGSFLEAGLIDEFSLVLAPIGDGTMGKPAVFDSADHYEGRLGTRFKLESVKRIHEDFLWLRYTVERRARQKKR